MLSFFLLQNSSRCFTISCGQPMLVGVWVLASGQAVRELPLAPAWEAAMKSSPEAGRWHRRLRGGSGGGSQRFAAGPSPASPGSASRVAVREVWVQEVLRQWFPPGAVPCSLYGPHSLLGSCLHPLAAEQGPSRLVCTRGVSAWCPGVTPRGVRTLGARPRI